MYGFYKGILPPILAETPKRAVKVTAARQNAQHVHNKHTNIGMCVFLAAVSSISPEACKIKVLFMLTLCIFTMVLHY